MTPSIYDDRVLRWLRDAYRAEYPMQLDPTWSAAALESPPDIPTYGAWVARLAESRYLARRGEVFWKDSAGNFVTERQGRWLLPVHEALKRLRPKEPHKSWLYHDWLLAILRTSSPCLCHQGDVVSHLADLSRTRPQKVRRCVLALARRVVGLVGDLYPDVPLVGRMGPPSVERNGPQSSYTHGGATSKRRPDRGGFPGRRATLNVPAEVGR